MGLRKLFGGVAEKLGDAADKAGELKDRAVDGVVDAAEKGVKTTGTAIGVVAGAVIATPGKIVDGAKAAADVAADTAGNIAGHVKKGAKTGADVAVTAKEGAINATGAVVDTAVDTGKIVTDKKKRGGGLIGIVMPVSPNDITPKP